MQISHPLKTRDIQRFMRFAVVGVTGTLVDFVLLVVLRELLGLPVLIANTLSYSAGIVNNFTLNRLWTFKEARSKGVWVQFGQFFAVSTAGLLLNNAIVLLLDTSLGALFNAPESGYLVAKVVATGVVLVWNFLINRYWTFNDVG